MEKCLGTWKSAWNPFLARRLTARDRIQITRVGPRFQIGLERCPSSQVFTRRAGAECQECHGVGPPLLILGLVATVWDGEVPRPHADCGLPYGP